MEQSDFKVKVNKTFSSRRLITLSDTTQAVYYIITVGRLNRCRSPAASSGLIQTSYIIHADGFHIMYIFFSAVFNSDASVFTCVGTYFLEVVIKCN